MNFDTFGRYAIEVFSLLMCGSFTAVLIAAAAWCCQKLWRTITSDTYVCLLMPNKIDHRNVNTFRVVRTVENAQEICSQTGYVFITLELDK